MHGLKGFVIPTKSFVKMGITKKNVTTTKCFVISTKRLVAAAKIVVAATKKKIFVPNFIAVTKPFFPHVTGGQNGIMTRGRGLYWLGIG